MDRQIDKNSNKKSNIVLALVFGSLLLVGSANLYINEKFSNNEKDRKIRLSQNFEFISARATSDVKLSSDKKGIVSYLVDVDFNEDGKTDKTIALVDNVKYVSAKRLDNISKIKNGSRLIFECNIDSYVKAYPNVDVKDVSDIHYPEIVVDSIYGTSQVGLIDHIIAVDGEKISNARKESNKLYVDYLDEYKNSDGKWNEKTFGFFYDNNLRGR